MNTSGNPASPIWLLGESWGKHEESDYAHTPFIGPSGWELNSMLRDSGLNRDDCFALNVCNARPPGDQITQFFHSRREGTKLGISELFRCWPNKHVADGVHALLGYLDRFQPRLVLALGNSALWAITGGKHQTAKAGSPPAGILKWRGSELFNDQTKSDILDGATFSVVPTVHPAAVLREYPFRYLAVQDFRRARRLLQRGPSRPSWNFMVRPNYQSTLEAIHQIHNLRVNGADIAGDIETRGGQIATIGLAWSITDAISIPLMCVERPEGYWSLSEEAGIIAALQNLLCDQKASGKIIFQNALYDAQYFAKQFGWVPNISDDTMLMQHTLFPGLRKGLDFLSSLYCEYHRYWKDDGKNWNPREHSEDQLWTYNCEDCIRTLEVFWMLDSLVDSLGRREQYSFQMRLWRAVLRTSLRGIRVNRQEKSKMAERLSAASKETEDWIKIATGRPNFNCRSNPQMKDLFLNEMGEAPVKKRGANNEWYVTFEDSALEKIASRSPILKPLTDKIREFRSIEVFKNNFAEMSLPPDGRMRCTFNLAGTVTFRFSSSEDAFGFGGNLQTIPKGSED